MLSTSQNLHSCVKRNKIIYIQNKFINKNNGVNTICWGKKGMSILEIVGSVLNPLEPMNFLLTSKLLFFFLGTQFI